tara:strand:- start:1485 stop:1679 length:195 start_codon:yes stop_codon:yes gene_type:complete
LSFLHILKKEERDVLRVVVKKVHLCHHPKEFCTDYEADKLIATIGPEVIESMIKFGKDRKVDQL